MANDEKTTDIVARLRGWPLDEWEGSIADDIEAAIAEIERLRAKLLVAIEKIERLRRRTDRLERTIESALAECDHDAALERLRLSLEPGLHDD